MAAICPGGYSVGDFNNDRAVNDLGATIMAANWDAGVATTASIPEPGTIT